MNLTTLPFYRANGIYLVSDKLQLLISTIGASKVSGKSTSTSWIRCFDKGEGSQGGPVLEALCRIGCLG